VIHIGVTGDNDDLFAAVHGCSTTKHTVIRPGSMGKKVRAQNTRPKELGKISKQRFAPAMLMGEKCVLSNTRRTRNSEAAARFLQRVNLPRNGNRILPIGPLFRCLSDNDLRRYP